MLTNDYVRPCGDGWVHAPTAQERIRAFMDSVMEGIELTPEEAEWFDRRRAEYLKRGPKSPSQRVPLGNV